MRRVRRENKKIARIRKKVEKQLRACAITRLRMQKGKEKKQNPGAVLHATHVGWGEKKRTEVS